METLHEHVTAAMLDGRNNGMFLHENRYESQRGGGGDYVVVPYNMAAFT